MDFSEEDTIDWVEITSAARDFDNLDKGFSSINEAIAERNDENSRI